MASKKFSILTGLLCLVMSASFAQLGSTYDLRDSSLIPKKGLPQHNEFLNNTYPFPARPRNQWELGLKVGAFAVSGDVRSRFPGFGAGLHVRKALGYVFSIRGDFSYGTTNGLNFSPSTGYKRNPAWAPIYAPGGVIPTTPIFYNYKTNIYDFSLQGVFTINNVRFHKAKTGFNVYGFAGIGIMSYDTKVDALNGSTPYNFAPIIAKYSAGGFDYSDRKDIKSDLKSLLDGSYETDAEKDPQQPKYKGMVTAGLGMAFKLSPKLNLALEDKFTLAKTDLLDGQQWQENDPEHPAQTRDDDIYNVISLGLNINLGSKRVEPLYWLNPLDYAYNEINAPRHMKFPKPILDDGDGDGVTDQFDQEPNTPAGAPVDSHGVSKDTDGDGVPDVKDKELITPTQCQPVDADGVGKCPDPECCKNIVAAPPACSIGNLPSVSFSGRSVALSNDAKAVLATVAQKLRDNPNCKVVVQGYGESSKAAQQLSWDRVNSVINYLVEKEGVSAERLIFKFGETGGDSNTVDLRDGTGEEGPNAVPAPHPNLRRNK